VITTLAVGSGQHSIDVIQSLAMSNVASNSSNDIAVISATQVITTLAVGHFPEAIGVNPSTGYVYVKLSGNSVSVLSATEVITTFAAGAYALCYRSEFNYRLYLSDQLLRQSGDGAFRYQVVATLKAAVRPLAVDVNPATGTFIGKFRQATSSSALQ